MLLEPLAVVYSSFTLTKYDLLVNIKLLTFRNQIFLKRSVQSELLFRYGSRLDTHLCL